MELNVQAGLSLVKLEYLSNLCLLQEQLTCRYRKRHPCYASVIHIGRGTTASQAELSHVTQHSQWLLECVDNKLMDAHRMC